MIALDGGRFTKVADLCQLVRHKPYLNRPTIESILAQLAANGHLQAHGFKNQYGAEEPLHELVDFQMIYGNFAAGSQAVDLFHGAKRLGDVPATDPAKARALLHSIDTSDVIGVRDRAVLATLMYTACRAGAVSKLRLRDYYSDGRQYYLRFDEKGGVDRQIPCRHDLQGFIEEYIATAGVIDGPLFRAALGRTHRLGERPFEAKDIHRMVKRRLAAAGLPTILTCHSFRATTATDLLEQGVPLGDVQELLGHADPRTTRLYDRRDRTVTRNVVERISI